MGYTYRPNRSNRLIRSQRKGVNFRKVGTLVTLVVFLLLIFVCVRFFTLFNVLRGSDMPVIWRPDSGERIQVLLAGSQGDDILTCTLLSIPRGEDEPVYVLRVPPHTLVNSPDDEATETLANIFKEQGLAASIQSINRLLGSKLPISHYVVYDIDGVSDIVAGINGLDVNIPAGFQASYGDTDYVFAPGVNKITANNVLPFIASDAGLEAATFWAEKNLLVSIFNELFSMRNISFLVTNFGKVTDIYSTDMTSRELARFRDTMQALGWEERKYTALPGRWLSSQGEKYWSADQQLVELTVQQILIGLAPYDKKELVVDLFNGNGVTGFAAKTASNLQTHGFRIGLVSNASEMDSTRIYYSAEYELAAREIALLLDIDAVLIEGVYINSAQPVAVILGKDLVGR